MPTGHILDANTLALYRFDTTTGSAIDATGTYTAPPAVGGRPPTVTGQISNAASYSYYGGGGGGAAYIVQLDTAGINVFKSGNWSWEGWVYRKGQGGQLFHVNGLNFSTTSADTILAEVSFTDDGVVHWHQFVNQLFSDTYHATPITLALNAWTHVAVTKTVDVNPATCTYRSYCNGVLVETVTGVTNFNSTSLADIGTTPQYMALGCYNHNTGFGAANGTPNANLDDMRISKIARSDSEILASYLAGSGSHAVGANTVVLYRHDETSSSSGLVDSGPHSLNATGVYSPSPAAPATGRVGGGRLYGATDNTRFYVDVTPSTTYLLPIFASNAFTVGHLFAWNAGGGLSHNPTPHYLFSCGVGDGSFPAFRYGFDGIHFFAEWMVSGTLYTYTSVASPDLNHGDWHFLGFKWNGTTLQIWLDGVLDSTYTPTSAPGAPSSVNTSIGTKEDGFYGWGGIGDEMWIESTTSVNLRNEAINYGFTPAGGTQPGAPTSVTATPGNAQAMVSWTAPSDDGGSSITGYTVTSSPGGHIATTTGATSANVTGLTNGLAYTFTVVAINAIGDSTPSSASNSVTPRTVPDAPTSVVAIAGSTAANVSWSAPASNGGAAITSYTVTSSPGGLTATTTDGSTLSIELDGLTNGTAYTFTVHASNVAGNSAESSPSSSITPDLTGGYGRSPYGQSGYGTGDVSGGGGGGGVVTQASLLVQSDTGVPGSQCVISGVGVPIVDKSRNDSFSGPVIDTSKWIEYPTGLVKTSFFESVLNVSLIDSTTAPSYTLIPLATSKSADVSVKYNIVSDPNISPVTHEIVFASLQYWVDNNTTFTIKRVLNPGISGQQVYVSYVVGGVEVSMASLQTKDTFGVLRLVKHNNSMWAIYNGRILYYNPVAFSTTGMIKISVDAGGHNAPLTTQLSNFTSDTGVLFGTALLLERDIQLGDKINGVVPQSTQVGPVDVVAFNHNGQIGSQTGGFKYPLITGVALSANQGMTATVQLDPVLRA